MRPDQANQFNFYTWALIQKDELAEEAISIPEPLNDVEQDNDLLARGTYHYTTTVPQRSEPLSREHFVFPEPIFVPRSPTFVMDTALADTLNASASLYYKKYKATEEVVLQLLKRYRGRKQDVVSNVPRVIDE